MDKKTPSSRNATQRTQNTKPAQVLEVPLMPTVKATKVVNAAGTTDASKLASKLPKLAAVRKKTPVVAPVAAATIATTTPAPAPAPATSAVVLNTQFLESLVGYNARRAALSIIGVFLTRMAPYGLRPVDFSVLSVIGRNPGATSRQLCAALNILPPNFVNLLAALEKCKLVERQPHPQDKRAAALHLTSPGQTLVQNAELTVRDLERECAARLTQAEHATLIRLLQKVYLP